MPRKLLWYRRCVVTRSSQGGQVQPLLTAPPDVSWQDKKGVYEVRQRTVKIILFTLSGLHTLDLTVLAAAVCVPVNQQCHVIAATLYANLICMCKQGLDLVSE